ncbi:hypothetical protein C6501_15760 [Candidatus Poribacteria bacterium]|nr:MAG: hypothetical protein C6501_15760 [Candidatus Poribacteria bacterium]
MNGRKVVLLCLILLLASTTAQAKIVFSSERNGVQGIYVMDDDGSNQTLLTEAKTLRSYSNCWSPDGKQIAFKRRAKRHSNFVVFLMNPDGTNIRQLTENDGSSIGKVSFSPDGTSIVFDRIVRIDNEEKPSIAVLNIETGKMKAIADISANFCDWSPDSKHIIFSKPVAVGGGGNTVWIMGADGHNPRPLVPEPPAGGVVIHRLEPKWSPDGKQIVFLQDEYTWDPIPNVGIALIYKAHRYMICDRNGENVRQLRIPKDWRPLSIDWMDDGKSVVFSAYVGLPLGELPPPFEEWPPANIYKYHLHTHVITRLTNHPGRDETLDWISDDVLPVTPRGKKKVTWGALKKLSHNTSSDNPD